MTDDYRKHTDELMERIRTNHQFFIAVAKALEAFYDNRTDTKADRCDALVNALHKAMEESALHTH